MDDLVPSEAEEISLRNERAAEIRPTPNDVRQEVIAAVEALGADGIFHGYQRRMIEASHETDLLVVEKSRRIGATWAFAGDDVVTAATAPGEGGDDVLYISYSHDMAREYIEACAGFARALMGIDADVGEFMFRDEDPAVPGESRDIKAFRIDFASGFSIAALSSRPRSLRGKQGKVRVDEAAFVDDLEELIKAAMALVMLGGSVVVLSTHNGVDNGFNQLIQRIRADEQEGQVLTITFADAIDDGLYDRVALKKGELPTEEGRAAYVAKIRKLYGSHAAEELDAVPSKGAGAWLTYDQIERAEDPTVPLVRLTLNDSFALQPDHLRTAFIAEWCDAHLLPILETFSAADAFGCGSDFARVVDLSVLWLLKELQNRAWRTALVVEMRNVPFREQEFVFAYVLRRLRRWRLCTDAGGSGLYITERMMQTFGASRVEAVHAREPWWRENGPPVKQRFEDTRLAIPQDKDTSADLRAVKVQGGVPHIPSERNTTKGEDAGKSDGQKAKRHADAAVALTHAGYALRQGVGGPVEFVSAGPSAVPGSATINEDAGFGAVSSELHLQGY